MSTFAEVARQIASGGSPYKYACRSVSTTNINLSTGGEQTISGVALESGQRCLVAGQTVASQNGIYVVFNTAWQRADDMRTDNQVQLGTTCRILEGSYAGTVWALTSPTTGTISLGSTSLTFEQVDDGVAAPPLPSTATVIQPSGITTGATDRAAIQAALTAGRPVYLVPGATYYLDAPIAITAAAPGALLCLDPSNPAHICRGSSFTPGASGAADDPANCLISYASTLAGADETTLATTVVRRGRTSM